MRRLLVAMLLVLPVPATADYLDVIKFKLNEGCSFATYVAVVKDINEWGKANGYKAEVLMPLQQADQEHLFFVGRGTNASQSGFDTY